ncbi:MULTISPECIES: DUF6773 family protein [Clostridium]|uniref:Uncharacterized protein n=1 Tax=Clostridium aquiflavi TaxID=3073603 RepID=A0ABU1ED89_9CLOT|nr:MULTISPECIES: DUF6773 family protein [unclassified Clostridium]MDR5586353.1 hypothetical protein [Clostridium sp. 5N-1]NFG63396.1 hypothetical protein [Clostridium botulinum]NFQ09124.1 hypothetical protein [Clostridium botulinum]
MNKRKNKLDEMQEQKLLKIERNGMWFAFWGLFATILIQSSIGKGDIIGELIVFMCLSIYIVFACLKNGIWDRKLEANIKTNIIVSSISGILCGITFFISSYLKYHKLLGSIATGIIMLSSVFALAFVTLTVFSSIYKKRIKKIEESCESKSDEAN